jgi:hypothetical protein
MRFTRPQHLLDDPKFNIHNVPHYESKGYVQNDLYAREDDLKRDDMYNQRLETQENTNEIRPTIIVPALAPIASPPSPVRPLTKPDKPRASFTSPRALLVVSVRPAARVKRDELSRNWKM